LMSLFFPFHQPKKLFFFLTIIFCNLFCLKYIRTFIWTNYSSFACKFTLRLNLLYLFEKVSFLEIGVLEFLFYKEYVIVFIY
jgi:hypothetical protein